MQEIISNGKQFFSLSIKPARRYMESALKLYRELSQWLKFFRVLLRLTWAERHADPCRQKVRRIVRAAEREWAG